MTALRLGLLQWRVERSAGVAAWAARLGREAAAAKARGVQLAVMPEYAPLEMAAGSAPDAAGELARMVALAPAALEAARGVAQAHGLWLLPGTLPFAAAGGIVSRAPLIAPDGRAAFQDKHVMTRFEAERWGVSPGAPPAVFETDWGRIGIAVCFDAEFPGLVRAQAEAGAWLVLVPSCTDTMHGYHRVRIATAARAMENQCFAAMAPTVGEAPWSAALDSNHGAAAVFGPADAGFPQDGVLAEGALDQPEWLVCDLDPARIEAVRTEGAVRNHASWPPAPPPCRAAAWR